MSPMTQLLPMSLSAALVLGGGCFSATASADVLPPQLLFATGAGGTNYDYGHGIAVDPGGTSLVTGFFQSLATFGAGGPNETTLESAGSQDIFVARYAPDGTLLWVRRAGGGYGDVGYGIAVDTHGNSLVTGSISGPVTFGAGEPKEITLDDGGMFLAKYAADGSLRWATQASAMMGRGIAVDADGNPLVSGLFHGTATFGAGEPNQTTLEGGNVFLAKYAANGRLLWAEAIQTADTGGVYTNEGGPVAVDAAGNVLVTGWFQGFLVFGEGEPEETLLVSAGSRDVFVAKYAPDGRLLWARKDGGAESEFGAGIAADRHGNSLVTGNFLAATTFGRGNPPKPR